MKMYKLLTVVLFVLISGCKNQTTEEQIRTTANKVLRSIKEGNLIKFKILIGQKLIDISKTTEMLEHDFKNCMTLYKLYIQNDNAKVIVTDEYTLGGSRKVLIPFFTGADSINNIAEARLELYFGPPQYVPLTKIEDYHVIYESLYYEPSVPKNIEK